MDPRIGDIVDRNADRMFSIAPRDLLTHPLWLHPKTASCTNAMLRDWWDPVMMDAGIQRIPRHSEVVNPMANTGGRDSPHGLLRYLDLDLMLALSNAFLTSGGCVEVALSDLFRWMGYANLLNAPYLELRASLRRLQNVSIATWTGARPPDLNTVRVLESVTYAPSRGHGSPVVIKAIMGASWTQSLVDCGWQLVDLDAYAHLTRTHRNLGLARVIFCYLTAHRRHDGTAIVLKDAIHQRFTPRKPDQKRLRYKDPTNPKSKLVQSMRALLESGVLEAFDPGDERCIGVKFTPERVPRLVHQPRQICMCTADIWGGGAAPQVIGHQPDPLQLALPAPEAPPDVTPAPQPAPDARPPAIAQAVAEGAVSAVVRAANAAIHVNITVVQNAVQRGWEDADIMAVLAQAAHKRSPAGWAATVLRGEAPAVQQRAHEAQHAARQAQEAAAAQHAAAERAAAAESEDALRRRNAALMARLPELMPEALQRLGQISGMTSRDRAMLRRVQARVVDRQFRLTDYHWVKALLERNGASLAQVQTQYWLQLIPDVTLDDCAHLLEHGWTAPQLQRVALYIWWTQQYGYDGAIGHDLTTRFWKRVAESDAQQWSSSAMLRSAIVRWDQYPATDDCLARAMDDARAAITEHTQAQETSS